MWDSFDLESGKFQTYWVLYISTLYNGYPMLKLLLIDDEPIEEKITFQLLKRDYGKPFQLEYAQSIEAGLELLKKRTFDIILLDDRISPTMDATHSVPLIRQEVGVTPMILISSSLDAAHLNSKEILDVYDIIDKYNLGERIRGGVLNQSAA